MSNKVSNNIFWLSFSRVFAIIFLALAYFALFRYLQPYKSGQYQFVLSYVLIFAIIVDFGIQQFITKKISEDSVNAKVYFQEFFSFEALVATILYGVLVSIAVLRHYDPIVVKAIAIAGLGMVSNALTYPYLAILSAFQDLKKVAIVNFLNSLVNISIIFLAIYFHRGIIFLSSVQLVFGVLDLVIYRFLVKKYLPNPEVLKAIFKFDFHLIKNILIQGWPFAVLVGFSAIYNRIDVIIITSLKGFEQTGLYTAAYKVFDLIGFFPAVVSFTLFPFFSGLMAKGAIEEIRQTLEKYLKLMFMGALPLVVGGMVLSTKLIALVAGPGYESSAPVLAILIWAAAILFIYIPVNSLVISQLTKKAVIITGVNVLINIIGNLILIPRFGIKAAAVMTIISESLQGIFYFYFVYKNITKFDFSSFLFKPAISAFVMGATLWSIKSSALMVTLPIGILIYFLMLVITGFLTKEDLQTFKLIFIKGQ